MKAKALVLTGFGINCEVETKNALEKNGATAKIMHVNDVFKNKKILDEYNFLVFPGGFSFGDYIASGRVFANKIKTHLMQEIIDFIEEDKLILGICNGFQVLVKLGLLPAEKGLFKQTATLTQNSSARFIDKWVYLKVNPDSPSIFTKGIDIIRLPIRHGEGKFYSENLDEIFEKNLNVWHYCDENGNISEREEICPNGSQKAIAGITNEKGTVFGTMPHPEANVSRLLLPDWTRGKKDNVDGNLIFKNAVEYLERL